MRRGIHGGGVRNYAGEGGDALFRRQKRDSARVPSELGKKPVGKEKKQSLGVGQPKKRRVALGGSAEKRKQGGWVKIFAECSTTGGQRKGGGGVQGFSRGGRVCRERAGGGKKKVTIEKKITRLRPKSPWGTATCAWNGKSCGGRDKSQLVVCWCQVDHGEKKGKDSFARGSPVREVDRMP